MAARKAKGGSEPVRVEALRGTVAEGMFAQGSKSERIAVFLETTAARYVLRRREGPAYADAKLQKLVGYQVECDGVIVSYVLIADRIRTL